jgi:GntR family transcriptional regulator
MFRIRIATGSSTPIYRQIVEQVRTAARLGVLSPGDALPSVRALSDELVVNANTIAKAYAELCREGTVESRAGKGMFVAEDRQVWSAPERRGRFEAAVDQFISEAIALRYTSEEIHAAVDERLARLWARAEKEKGGGKCPMPSSK